MPQNPTIKPVIQPIQQQKQPLDLNVSMLEMSPQRFEFLLFGFPKEYSGDAALTLFVQYTGITTLKFARAVDSGFIIDTDQFEDVVKCYEKTPLRIPGRSGGDFLLVGVCRPEHRTYELSEPRYITEQKIRFGFQKLVKLLAAVFLLLFFLADDEKFRTAVELLIANLGIAALLWGGFVALDKFFFNSRTSF